MSSRTKRPGQWPVTKPADLDALSSTEVSDEDELYVRRAAEIALRELVMSSIRHHLDSQPSPACVQSAARRLCAAIFTTADEVARTKRSST
ncbi:hypothetical protein [Streptomyces sp. NPDC058252]|uniref:hypothetical protein n=1 Tax=Streptomyces sp. NPDC058252 TaxID=3346405 RepID=UPI0036EAB7AB